MPKVVLNGVHLSDEALSELRYLQQGVDREEQLPQGDPNSGLNERLGSIDKVTRFLIALEDNQEPAKVLSHLKDLMYLRDTLNALRLPDGDPGTHN